ncbi:WD repeat-containing protein 93 isoform X2 [Zootoca vivipara]|uniref:WD repeat-containing protein 93 isoform X2 n=1 Tax=Zootoca vivipara TaxID=8524 RepID=UPI00293BA9A3|nr:WD repeat-containing protein 93 isoform X2 [Zootoca vivipara]
MPFYVRKHTSLEIPSPTEKDWIKKDEEEDIYLKDPYGFRDTLPQPYRMINKLVNLLLERTWEIVEGPQPLQETRQPKVPPPKYPPSSEFQVEGRANCMVAAGEFIFIGFSMGLSVFSIPTYEKPTYEKVCAWEAASLEICAIKVSNFGSSSYLIGSVDELGIARLFYFFKENLLSIKVINEVEDISKRNTCVALELSRGADYAGFLLQGNSEAWLEVYRLPKDSWLKETENAQNAALTVPANIKDMKVNQANLPEKAAVEADKKNKKTSDIPGLGAEEVDPQVLLSRLESRLIPPVLLLKIRSPKPFAPSTFKHPYEALMKSDDGSVIGLGYNHMLKESQWERQEAIFNSTFQQYLETEDELEIKEEKPSNAMFHFHLPGRTLPVGTEFRAEPDMPIALSIHWSRSHNLCFYLLSRPPKEKIDSDPKPDMVWPCASPLMYSAVTPCSSYLAFACEDGTVTVWEKSVGFPLSVTVLPDDRYVIRSIQFMPCAPSPCEKVPGSSEVLASTKVKLLVLCTDGSLHLITSGAKEFDTQLLGPEIPNQTITAIATISSLPDTVLMFFWDGTVILMDTTTEDYISQFIMPPSYKVATSWQPVFSVDTQGQYLLLQGVKQQTETIFIFDFTTYPFMEAFTLKAEEQPEALAVAVLPWDKRCNIFLKDSLQRLSTISQQIPESWSLLQNCAKALAKGESQEMLEEEESRDAEEP